MVKIVPCSCLTMQPMDVLTVRLNPKQTSDLQLSLEFGVAPGTNIAVLVYGEFENLLEIESNGAVLYEIYQH